MASRSPAALRWKRAGLVVKAANTFKRSSTYKKEGNPIMEMVRNAPPVPPPPAPLPLPDLLRKLPLLLPMFTYTANMNFYARRKASST